MNLRAVWKAIGPIQIIFAFAMLFSSLISIYFQESPFPLLIGSFISLIVGFALYLFCRNANLKNEIRIKEGFAITTFAWILAALIWAIPFYLANFPDLNQPASFVDSFFEAMSGFTTTGSSILSNIEQFPKGILFWRSFTHWFGGMGIIVLAIAILPQLSIGGMQIYNTEASWPLKKDKLMPRIKDIALILWKVYLIFTITEFVILILVGLNWYDALTHTFGTIATGGFSTYNNSIAGLNNPTAEIVITIFMILAGINFALYFSLFKGKINSLFDRELLVYLGITFGIILLIIWNLQQFHFYSSFGETVRMAFFQVPAIITTTGYTNTNFDLWPNFSKWLLFILMFLWGSAGSTSGGFKIIRYLIIFKYIGSEIKKIINPHLISSIKLGNKSIEQSSINSILAFGLIYLAFFFFWGVVLSFFDLDLITAFSASIASLGNIWPGFGLINASANYGFMPDWAKLFLCFLMLAGRLEIFTVLIILLPQTWRNNRRWI